MTCAFSTRLDTVAEAIRNGDLRTAKFHTTRLLADADPHTSALIAACVDTIERFPRRAVVHLRARWKAATTDDDRAVIAAFGQAARPAPEPPTIRRSHRTAPRDLDTSGRTGEIRHLTPERRAALRIADRAIPPEPAVEEPATTDRVYASGLDYDRAAVPALRGTPCVRCWTERTREDHRADGDDGLCGECRDRGRPGVPALPPGHTRADAVQARCAFLAATYNRPRALLAQWWRKYATVADRVVIADWVQRNPLPTDPGPAPRPRPVVPRVTGRCERCGDHADQELCVHCREVDDLTRA
ncbi:hypothetical protein GCM10022243_25320 [Saccharothrix violaceirubra]|uniref:Uncharacterized protein n=1 Tax=Saccharothrix violaceirubra TaxID=413306 RepID=A0A7W7SZ18_9PSEU|nr:hypothetical protein [Saccharothrix violaceirubra]MBB4963548.1 hypothetical protein [Saccharothrix violaceirubra]